MNKPNKPIMLQLLEESAEAQARKEMPAFDPDEAKNRADEWDRSNRPKSYYGTCSICHGRLFEGEILRCTPCNKRDVANDELPF